MMFNEFMSQVAREYTALGALHNPYSFEVRSAYLEFCKVLTRQFDALTCELDFVFTDVDPYPTSAAMFEDISRNDRLRVYTSADLPAGHPLATMFYCGRASDVYGRMPMNLVFRAVHDALAHYPERNNFSAVGEFRAFKAHARTMAGNLPAIKALATETIGQNSWVNFGHVNRALEQIEQRYAPQYCALLPWQTIRKALTEVQA